MTKKQKTRMGICFLLTFGTFMSQQVFADAQQTATDAAMIGYDVSGTLEGNPMSAIDLDKKLDKYTHINQKAVDLDKKLDKYTHINQKAVDLDKKLDENTGINQKAVDVANTVQNQAQNVETQVAQGAKDFGNQVSSAFKRWHW